MIMKYVNTLIRSCKRYDAIHISPADGAYASTLLSARTSIWWRTFCVVDAHYKLAMITFQLGRVRSVKLTTNDGI